MSISDEIKRAIIAPYGDPIYRTPQATNLWLWTIAAIVIEITLIIFFTSWSLYHGVDFLASRGIGLGSVSMALFTTLMGAVLCFNIDKNENNTRRIVLFKIILMILILITLWVLIILYRFVQQ